jgi:hypothetical protein
VSNVLGSTVRGVWGTAVARCSHAGCGVQGAGVEYSIEYSIFLSI